MQQHTLNIQSTAHYYTLGTPGEHVKQFWIVCHGYAQLADEFLENFKLLENDHTLVVAPEGLNHFYRKGFDGPVGANWMTRRHRTVEIEPMAITSKNSMISMCPSSHKTFVLYCWAFRKVLQRSAAGC